MTGKKEQKDRVRGRQTKGLEERVGRKDNRKTKGRKEGRRKELRLKGGRQGKWKHG